MYDTCNRVTSCLHQTQAVWRDTTDALYLMGLICILIFFWYIFYSAFLFLALHEMSYKNCLLRPRWVTCMCSSLSRESWHFFIYNFHLTDKKWRQKHLIDIKSHSKSKNQRCDINLRTNVCVCVCTGDFGINVTESPRKWNTKPGEIVNRKPTLRSKCFSNMACIYLKHIGIRKKTDFLFPWH